MTTGLSVRVRALGADDAAAYQALRLQGLLESPSAFASSHEEERDIPLAAVGARLANQQQGCVLGAFDAGRLLGVVGLRRESLKKLAHKAHIWGMYVEPSARRFGIGRQLVARALEQAAATEGVRQVTLGVNAANAPAVGLYEGMGFVSFGREQGCLMVDGVLHDELHMVRRLAPADA